MAAVLSGLTDVQGSADSEACLPAQSSSGLDDCLLRRSCAVSGVLDAADMAELPNRSIGDGSVGRPRARCCSFKALPNGVPDNPISGSISFDSGEPVIAACAHLKQLVSLELKFRHRTVAHGTTLLSAVHGRPPEPGVVRFLFW